MNIGGMQITDGATYDPTRTDDPPGTTRTRSATANFRAGKVSLSTNESPPSPIALNTPSLNPSRIPCFTQAFTTHCPSCFSAARTLPCVSASRNSRKTCRASGFCSTSPMEASFSIEDFREFMGEQYTRLVSCPVNPGIRGNSSATAHTQWEANFLTTSDCPSNALALAADQHPLHVVRDLSRLGEGWIRPVPLRMVRVRPGGPSLAMITLPATGTMQHDLVRSRQPVLVDIKLGSFRRGCRGSGDQSHFHGSLLQFLPPIPTHGEKRQSVHFLDPAHHGQHRLHRQRARLDEVRLHQRQIFPVDRARGGQVIVQGRARHLRHFPRDFIRRHRNDAHTAQRNHR